MPDALEALSKACTTRPGTESDSVSGVVPSYVAEPGTVAEAAEAMRIAAEQGLSVVPRGAGTRLGWGAPPDSCDLLIDTTRLDHVIEHAAGDLVVKVEAGVTMDRLAEVLAAKGQRLAVDIPLAGSTVGGTLAIGAAGPLRLRYGTARDLLIGVTIVRADGSIAKSGGKVVKNVAGYDLGKLFTGSYGTLGLIAEAAFRLHPLPAARRYVTATVADGPAANRAVQAVLHSSAVPSAIEVDAPPGGPISLSVLVEGVAEGIPARAELVAELLGPDARIDADLPPWWGRYPDGATLIDVTAPPTALPAVLQAAGAAGVRGSAGSGHWQVGMPGDLPADRVAELAARLRAALTPDGGSAIVRVAPDDVRTRVDLWGPASALTLMRRVKDQFDPDHRLAPGRFVGGI
ncbi:MAG TPA: FAD-binding oxidoreductase [Streptosporangiaceae bacterium]|jgi:glycolate oxidase FAD binding subunit